MSNKRDKVDRGTKTPKKNRERERNFNFFFSETRPRERKRVRDRERERDRGIENILTIHNMNEESKYPIVEMRDFNLFNNFRLV